MNIAQKILTGVFLLFFVAVSVFFGLPAIDEGKISPVLMLWLMLAVVYFGLFFILKRNRSK